MIFLNHLMGMLMFRPPALRSQAERRMFPAAIACFSVGFLAFVLLRNRIYAELPEIADRPVGLIHSILELHLLQTLLFLLAVYVPALVLLGNLTRIIHEGS